MISCSSGTRRDYLEGWKVRRHMKERCLKWKSLPSFGEASGRERKKNPIDAMDGRDKKTTG